MRAAGRTCAAGRRSRPRPSAPWWARWRTSTCGSPCALSARPRAWVPWRLCSVFAFLGGFQRDALFGVEVHEDRMADRRAQRRVAAREQRALAQLHLEIHALAEEDLLVHARLAHVLPV